MLKKKGFTLVELLAVIIVIGIIGLIVTPVVMNIVRNSKEKAYKIQIESLKNATQLYGTENIQELNENIAVKVTFKKLQEKGYLDSGEELINPITNEKLSGCMKVKYNNEYKQYEYLYDENCETDIACFDYEDTTVTADYEIDYDGCIKMFTEENAGTVEEIQNFCKGTGRLEYTEMRTLPEFISMTVSVMGFEQGFNEIESTTHLIKAGQTKSGIKITKYNCAFNEEETSQGIGVDIDPVIPKEINGKPVILIGPQAFYYGKDPYTINSVTFPDGLLYIDMVAFPNLKIKEVNFSDSILGIGYAAFMNNEIQAVNLPKQLEILGYISFQHNKINKLTVSPNLSNIETEAFGENSLEEVNIPENITYIAPGAFAKNRLKNVDIPNTVKAVQFMAFSYNQLNSVHISPATFFNSGVFNNNQMPDDTAFIYKTTPEGTFDTSVLMSYAGSKKDNIQIPSNVKTIGRHSFSNISLNQINIPNTVTKIEQYAFTRTGLTNVTISNNVTSIDEQAFSYNSLTNVVLPDSLTSIGVNAFSSNKLSSITIPKNVTSIGKQAFSFNTNLTKVINTTGRPFDWGLIISGSSGYNFVTGTVKVSGKTVIVSAS